MVAMSKSDGRDSGTELRDYLDGLVEKSDQVTGWSGNPESIVIEYNGVLSLSGNLTEKMLAEGYALRDTGDCEVRFGKVGLDNGGLGFDE